MAPVQRGHGIFTSSKSGNCYHLKLAAKILLATK
jgi:hypothetical protein